MYPNDQSISSYSSNPSTPVNSPPPLTQTPGTALSIHNSTPSTSWQQLTPANVVLNNSPAPVLNGIQNGQYAPELVHRGLHMVITINPFVLRLPVFALCFLTIPHLAWPKRNVITCMSKPTSLAPLMTLLTFVCELVLTNFSLLLFSFRFFWFSDCLKIEIFMLTETS